MTRSAAALLLALALVGGCTASDTEPAVEPSSSPSSRPAGTPGGRTTAAEPTRQHRPAPGTVPPPWLGERPLPEDDEGFGEVRPTPPRLRHRRFTLPDTVAPLPGNGFAARVVSPAPEDVIARSTWAPGCPVGRDDLAWIRLTFAGFDDARHTGELLVNASVADDVVDVFHELYDARFPIEQMTITTKAALHAPPTGDGNGTGGFVCRPTTGGTSYSQHAYGLAIDVNTFQNPYVNGDLVLPELASSYLDRGDRRPGMIFADGPVVAAFAAIGWEWGGAWQGLKDYQHFSRNGT